MARDHNGLFAHRLPSGLTGFEAPAENRDLPVSVRPVHHHSECSAIAVEVSPFVVDLKLGYAAAAINRG
jgi:hypothetical protein